ncbi:hypothetical protein [uncultured Jannaschia sp.]|uniref:sulfotransferase family protein n=1 Tax=uncultured Jannaschia sp. TaxID=293347 RepID=UPI00262C6083|nr:hypothetical protein [uncultured Jannaschia sp.]
MQTCIIILSMHRSGSSALARVLNLIGFALPRTLIPGNQKDNDLGFWESQPLVDLDDAYLKAAGSHWYDLAPVGLDLVSDEAREAFVGKAVEIIGSEVGEAPFFVMKDPRMSLLFPLWREALQRSGIRTLCVLPVRNPLDVAESLHARNRILRGEALVSWLRFVLTAERDTRGLPRVYVHYDDLVADWRSVTRRLASGLDIQPPEISEAVAHRVDGFLSAKWRHHLAGDAAVFEDALTGPSVKDTYRILRRWCAGARRDGDEAELDAILRRLDEATPIFRKLAVESRELSVEARALNRDRAKLESELREHREAIETMRTERDAARTRLEALTTAADDRVARLEQDRRRHVAALESDLAALARRADEDRTSLRDAREALARLSAEVSARIETYARRPPPAPAEAPAAPPRAAKTVAPPPPKVEDSAARPANPTRGPRLSARRAVRNLRTLGRRWIIRS